jgi:hypothetical protein
LIIPEVIEPNSVSKALFRETHTLLSLCSKNWTNTFFKYSLSTAALTESVPLAVEMDWRGVSTKGVWTDGEFGSVKLTRESRGDEGETVFFSMDFNRFSSSDRCYWLSLHPQGTILFASAVVGQPGSELLPRPLLEPYAPLEVVAFVQWPPPDTLESFHRQEYQIYG